MKSYKVQIGSEIRVIKGFNLKDAKNTAKNIKFYNSYKGKTHVKAMSTNDVFDYLKSL